MKVIIITILTLFLLFLGCEKIPLDETVGKKRKPNQPSGSVILLDFDGHSARRTQFNTYFGLTVINSTPSTTNQAQRDSALGLVNYYYNGFNTIATLSETVFNSYPTNKRIRVVITPLRQPSWNYNSGEAFTGSMMSGQGLAYVYEHRLNPEAPKWAFRIGNRAAHEAGHCAGLGHISNYDSITCQLIDTYRMGSIMGETNHADTNKWDKMYYPNCPNLPVRNDSLTLNLNLP